MKKEYAKVSEKKEKDKKGNINITQNIVVNNESPKVTKKDRKVEFSKWMKLIDDNRNLIFSFVGGALVVALITVIIWPDRIATLSDGTQPILEVNGETITADFLYEEMKKDYSISYLIEYIDKAILDEKYEEDDEMKEEIEKTAQNYFDMYEQYYGMDEATFLSQNGFESKDQFLDVLKLDYRRKLYYDDYLKSQITDEQIQKYYDEEVYGDINTQHLLVTIDDDMSEEDAKALAEEIIAKLDEGKSFEDVKEEYADKTTYENLKYVAFNANLESSFLEALEKLGENSYTKEPVKTSYGYHVIYRTDQKEKPSLDDVKDTIIEELCDELDASDENLYNKTLVKMREEAGLEFSDTVMEKKYQEYIKDYK